MLAVRPTILTAVPRRARGDPQPRADAGRREEPPWRQALFHRALALGLQRLGRPPLALAERLLDALLDRLVRAKVRARFGGRLKAAVSGGARLEPDVGRFFLASACR